MRTFSVAEQSIVEPDTGLALQFIPDLDGDSAKVQLRLTRAEGDPIVMHFDRNGRYVRTEYVIPLTDDDLKVRDALHEANARAIAARNAHNTAVSMARPVDEIKQRRDEYDAAVKAQVDAQKKLNERENERREEQLKRSQVDPDKPLPMTPPQPGIAFRGAETAPNPAVQKSSYNQPPAERTVDARPREQVN